MIDCSLADRTDRNTITVLMQIVARLLFKKVLNSIVGGSEYELYKLLLSSSF